MIRLRKMLFVILFVLISIAVFCYVINNKRTAASTHNGWKLMLVNDEYYIPTDYEIDLIKFDNGEKVDKRIYQPLTEMFENAKNEQIYMVVADGYRSEAEQQKILDEKTEYYEERYYFSVVASYMAQKWVALPGTSEHQLGLAVDINADITKSSSAEVYRWLAVNAHKYGFIQRYPSNKENITGIRYEPWHYRYVGTTAAKEIYENNLCLEEYLMAK